MEGMQNGTLIDENSLAGCVRTKNQISNERFWRTVKYNYIYIHPEEASDILLRESLVHGRLILLLFYMSNKQILYGTLLYEVNSKEGANVSLIESSGLICSAAKYGTYESSTTDFVLSIPEIIEDENGVKYTVTKIGKSAFDNNNTLQEVRIPRSVTVIEWGFWACTNLRSIIVDSDNPAYCDVEGVLYTKDGATLVAYPSKHGKAYKVKDGTRIIDHFAFKNTSITELEVPPSLQEIRTNAFYRCSSLRYVSARGIKWPIRVAPMTGEHGDVNPFFHYAWFSLRMNSSFHNQEHCEVLPTSGTIVETLKTGLSLASIEYENHKYYGVCDNQNNWIIKPLFSKICVHYNSFFEVAFCSGDSKSQHVIDTEDCEQKVIWFDARGERIYKKQLIELSESLLLYDLSGHGFDYSDNPKGILYSAQGEQILDSVEGYRDVDVFLFFVNNGKIGIYDNTGKEVVPIEYNGFDNVTFCPQNTSYPKGYYKKYDLDHVFDTEEQHNNEHSLVAPQKRVEALTTRGGVRIVDPLAFNAHSPFILHGEKHSLFSLKTGIVPDCAFDGIYPLTVSWYVVKDGQCYGVFDLDSQRLLVPCVYDRLQYQGANIVLVCKEGLWGALSLDVQGDHNSQVVSIPTEYYEIRILNKDYSLFGVKMMEEWCGKDRYRHTILNANGEEYKNMDSFHNLDSPFTFFTEDRILSSRNKRFGFISADGYVTIPFKYDKISLRSDGFFDVSVGNRWGVLSIDGREIIQVKYTHMGTYNMEQTDNLLSYSGTRSVPNRIVIDADSEGFGVLNRDGSELIPTKYAHILDDGDLFYYARERVRAISKCEDNWFDALFWGAIDNEGREITKPIYKCFDRQGKWLLAAAYARQSFNDRDECIFVDCVYDIYDLDTRQKVFGGIKEIKDTDNPSIKLLRIPLQRNTQGFSQRSNSVSDDEYKFVNPFGCWVIVNMENLKSVIPTLDGQQYQFCLGDEFRYVKPQTAGGEYTYSHPKELFVDDSYGVNKPIVYNDYTVFKQEKYSYLVRNNDGRKSAPYFLIYRIEEHCFYACKYVDSNYYWSILINGEEILPLGERVIMLTRICKGYCFAAKEIDEKNASVLLIHCGPEGYHGVTVISKISLRALSSMLWDDRLKLYVGDDKLIYVKDKEYFESGISDELVMNEDLFAKKDLLEQGLDYYWFTCSNRLMNAGTYDDWE